MSKTVSFILGIVTGVFLTFGGLFVLAFLKGSEGTDRGVTMFEQPGEEMMAKKYEVFQVIPIGALANAEEKGYSISTFTGPVVLFLSNGQNAYYDDEVITVPTGKKVQQVGTYRYETNMGYKTVPIVQIME